MNYRNVLCLLLFFVITTGFASLTPSGGDMSTAKWLVSKNSSLSVDGSTNVNKFSCVISTYDEADTLILSKNKIGQQVMFTGTIGLSISSFDCRNSGMTKQLRKTLDEKDFPKMHIRFLSLNKLPVLAAQPEPVTGWVDIEIAGVSKRFEVNYQITQTDQKSMQLLGNREVNFSDFNLVPPKKLGGMIATKDQLSVGFQLNMKAMD